MSKSLGNVISPIDVVAKSGADIVRLWVASADYGQDVSVSDEILDRTSEAYRRIRNTFRFLLSNLYDFDPATDRVAFEDMPELDRFALVALERSARPSHDRLRRVALPPGLPHHLRLRRRPLVGLSRRAQGPPLRRCARPPVAPQRRRRFSPRSSACSCACLRRCSRSRAKRCGSFMPEAMRDAESVQLAGWPTLELPAEEAAELRDGYAVVLEVREVVTKALEDARNAKVIGKSQEAGVAAHGASWRDGRARSARRHGARRAVHRRAGRASWPGRSSRRPCRLRRARNAPGAGTSGSWASTRRDLRSADAARRSSARWARNAGRPAARRLEPAASVVQSL